MHLTCILVVRKLEDDHICPVSLLLNQVMWSAQALGIHLYMYLTFCDCRRRSATSPASWTVSAVRSASCGVSE
jgi:hypothetical protein